MNYALDCEFIENGTTIDLISLALVAEDGRELYMQSTEFKPYNASAWVEENVYPYLEFCTLHCIAVDSHHMTMSVDRELDIHKHGHCAGLGRMSRCPWYRREQMKLEILSFMNPEVYGKPQLIGYYSSYDHVAFCQIFGTMMDLPEGYPMYTYDLRQALDMAGLQHVTQAESNHHSLEDAQWIMHTYKSLGSIKQEESKS